ncbi:MAG: acylphosphatase [Nitrospinae bacterium]|nr:acylphosphatase [Nitrospinota bacterium]
MKEMARARIIVKGRVQGVSYRAYTVDTASALGLTGWVKNTPGGDVEITAEGAKGGIERLIKWCENGPSLANVRSVHTEWEPFVGEFSDFDIAY